MQAVLEILPVEGNEDDILARAASLSYLADFSITRVLVGEAKARGLALLSAAKFESIPGKGAKALIDGMMVQVGSPKLLVEERIAVPVSFAKSITSHSREGKVVLVVLSGRSLSGALVLSNEEETETALPSVDVGGMSVNVRITRLFFGVIVLGVAVALWFSFL